MVDPNHPGDNKFMQEKRAAEEAAGKTPPAGPGAYQGRTMDLSDLVQNDQPTDDAFALLRDASEAFKMVAAGGIVNADQPAVAKAIGLADSGGTRGVGTAHTYRGPRSDKLTGCLVDWNAWNSQVQANKHPDGTAADRKKQKREKT